MNDVKSSTRWLAAVHVLAMLTLAGCAAPSPLPTATTTPIFVLLSPTSAPAEPPTSRPPTQTPTPTPTPFTPSPTPPPTPFPNPTPTQSFIKAASVPSPPLPISPETADQVNLLALWESDRHNSAAAFSPDGRLLAMTSSEGIHLYDGETLEATRFIESKRLPQGLAFSPDGESLASGAAGGRVQIWRVSDGKLLTILESSTGAIESVAFSPDGEFLAGGASQGSVHLWRLADGALIHSLQWGKGDANTVAFSSNGELVASGTSKGRVRLWRVTDEALVHGSVMAGREGSPVAVSPDGTFLAAGGGEGQVELWELPGGIPLRSLIGHTRWVYCVAFSPDGTLLATGAGDETIRLWQVSDGALLHTLPGRANTLTFSPDGMLLVSTARDHTVGFWGVGPSALAGESAAAPTPTATATPLPASPFHRVTLEEGLPAGEISDVWSAAGGRLWIAGESGIFFYDGGAWTSLYDGMANRILGNDEAGRTWALMGDGWRIGAYRDGAWTFYGAEQGWRAGGGGAPVTDRWGRVWLATGDAEVRRFDPETQAWETFTAAEIDFEPLDESVEPGLFLTDVAVDLNGNVWVGSCIHHGIGIEGQGVRWFDGERWSSSSDTAGECVMDIKVDSAGRVWMGGFDALIRYDPAAGDWSRIPLPVWERRQIITSVTLDSADRPWVTFTRFGGAGPWHSSALVHLEGSAWAEDYDPGDDIPMLLAPAPDGTFWLCADGEIYHLMRDRSEAIGRLGGLCRQMAVDGSGRLWIAGETGDGFALWWYGPGE